MLAATSEKLPRSNVEYGRVGSCTVLYCTVLYCTVLYCTVLQVGSGCFSKPQRNVEIALRLPSSVFKQGEKVRNSLKLYYCS